MQKPTIRRDPHYHDTSMVYPVMRSMRRDVAGTICRIRISPICQILSNLLLNGLVEMAMRINKFYFSALFFLVNGELVSADVTVENYHQFKGNVDQFDDYLVGVGRGVFWTNIVLDVEGRDKIFCMPKGLSLDQGTILSVIDQEIRRPTNRGSWGKDVPVELIAVHAFRNKFPCQ